MKTFKNILCIDIYQSKIFILSKLNYNEFKLEKEVNKPQFWRK